MKKIFFTLIAVMTIAISTFAQDATKMAVTGGDAALAKSKISQVYNYVLPEAITQEHIDRVSKYYTSYFTISFNEENKATKVTLKDVKGASMVMGRFLSSCNVREIKIDDKVISLDEFMKNYLR